jgi:glutaredoxin-like YruB-family protein
MSQNKKVTIYSTPTCVYCHTLKEFLKSKNIEFTEIDLSKNPEAAQTMMQKSGQMGVPQTLIEDEIVVGFDEERISSLLGL